MTFAEGFQNPKSGSELTGGGRQCWGLVLKCYELKTRQHESVKYRAPSSLETAYPFGYNESRTKVMKEKTFVRLIND
jgi:hypothetical protein